LQNFSSDIERGGKYSRGKAVVANHRISPIHIVMMLLRRSPMHWYQIFTQYRCL